MSNGLASLLRNPRRLQQFAETPGNYPAALSFAGAGQSRVAGRAAPRTSKSEEEAGVLETGEVIDKVKLPDGSYVRPATQSGQIVKVPGRSNLFVDPATGEPFQADPAKPTGLRSAFETARKVARGGKLFAVVPGVGEREIGADPEAEAKAKEQAAKREAENLRLQYAQEKRPYNWDRVAGRPVPTQSDEEWAKAKQEKADKLAEAAAVKKLKAQADKLDIDADRLSLTTPKVSPEEAAAYDAAVSSLEGFAADKDLDTAAEELANAPDSEDEDQNAAKATAQSYLSLRDKVKPAKDAEEKAKELKLRALDLKEQMLDPDAWKAGKAASLAELPDADLAAEAKAQADIITEQETEAQGTLELVAKGRADLEQKHAAFMAERQAAEAQGLSLEQRQALDAEQAQFEAEMADYDDWNAEAVTSAQGSLKASQDRREVLAAAGAEIDRRNKAAQEQFQVATEKAAVMEKAKPLYNWAKDNFHYTDDYRGMNDYGILDAEAKKAGLDPKQAREALQTFRQLDWSNPRIDTTTGKPLDEKARVLPDGNVTVNPGLLLDPQAYDAAVDEAETTPEAKARAKAMRAELAGPVAAEALKNLRKNSSFAEWLDENTKGNDVERMEQFNASMKEGGALNAAVMKFLGSTAGLPSGWLGAIAGLTGSDTALEYARYWQDRAQAYQTAAGEAGKGTNMAGRFMASVAGGVPSVMESLAAGGVAGRVLGAGAAALGASAIDAAAQSGGGTFVDAVDAYMQQGLSQEEAKAKAAAPAIASGLATGVLTALGSGGVESLLRPGGQALGRAAIKRGIMAQIGEGVSDEAAEEWADQMMQGIIAQLTYDPNKPLEQVFAEATEAGLVGGVLGGGASGLRGYLDRNAPAAPAQPQAQAGPAPTPGTVAPAQISQPAQTGDIAGAIKAFTPTGEAMLPQAVADTVKRTNRTTEDVSRAAASGLVKVAQGASLESLDAREREALGFVSKDGKIIPAPKTTPLVETYKGKLVIRNEAAEWLDDEGQPLLARQIRLDEAERKAQIDEAEAKPAAKKKAGQAKEKAAESQSQAGLPAKSVGSLPTEGGSIPPPATISGATEAPKSSQTITGSNAEMAAEMPVQPATAGEAPAPTPEPTPANEQGPPPPESSPAPEAVRPEESATVETVSTRAESVVPPEPTVRVVPEQPPAPAQETAPEPEPAAGGGLTPAQAARATPAQKAKAARKKDQAVPASQVTARQEAPPAPVDEAAAQAATSPASPAPEPSEAQKEAGNYKKGHAKIGGLDISIENEAGTKRRPEWGALSDHYGYIKGTVDNTGEQVDVFIKPGTPEDYAGPVFVVTQNDPKTGKFDEFKTIIGYGTAAEAEQAYRANYTADWQGFGGIQEMSLDEFKAGLADMTAREKAAREPGQPVSQAGQAVSEPPAPVTPLAKAKAAIADYTAKAKAEKAAAKTQEAKNAANRKIVGAAWLAKRLEAFDGVVDYAVATEYNGKPIQGMMVIPAGRGGLFVINPAGAIDQLAENNLGKEALYKAIDKFLVHEFIHQAALSRLNDKRILDLYNALTPEAKAASRRLYLAQAGEGQGELDEFQAAHEWFAQLVEARMSGEISNQALIEASDDPAFRDKLAALFREFVAALREIAGLVKDPAMAEQIRAEADAVEAAVRQMAEKAGLAERQAPAPAQPAEQAAQASQPVEAAAPMGQAAAAATITKEQAEEVLKDSTLKDRPIKTYEMAVAANQIHMGTKISDWSAFPFTGEAQDGKPTQDLTGASEMQKAPTLFPSSNAQEHGNCEWCGKQPVKNFYFIKDDGKKWTLAVGSECITHFADKSGDEMAREARQSLALAAIQGITEARKTLSKEFSEIQSAGYGRTERVWKNPSARTLNDETPDILGKITIESGAAAHSRWLNTKLEAAREWLARYAELMARPETKKRQIEWRTSRIKELEISLKLKNKPEWELASLEKKLEELRGEKAAMEGTAATPPPAAPTAADEIAARQRVEAARIKADDATAKREAAEAAQAEPEPALPASVTPAQAEAAATYETQQKPVKGQGRSNAASTPAPDVAGERSELQRKPETLQPDGDQSETPTSGAAAKDSDEIQLLDLTPAQERILAQLPKAEAAQALKKGLGYDRPQTTTHRLPNDPWVYIDRQGEKRLGYIDQNGKPYMLTVEESAEKRQNIARFEAEQKQRMESRMNALREDARIQDEKRIFQITPSGPAYYRKGGKWYERGTNRELGRKKGDDLALLTLEGPNAAIYEVKVVSEGGTMYYQNFRPAPPVTAQPPAVEAAGKAEARPMNMAGETRPAKPAKAGPPEFASLPQASQDKFNAAYEANSAEAMGRLLFLSNKGLRAEFEKRTGIKLPKTEKGTTEAIQTWAAKPSQPEAQPASQAPAAEAGQGREEAADKPPVGKITDFGEKIFGARKDVWGKFKRIMDQAFPESYDDVTLSRNVPEPDYEAAIEAGVSVDDLALLKAIRDNLPPKPKKSWKLKNWGDAVKFLHQLTQDVIAGKGIDPAVLTGLERTQRLSGLSNAIKLYKYLGYPLFTKAKGWTVANWDVGYYKGQKLDKFTPATIATKDERSTDMLVLRAGEEAWREVAEMIKITLAGQPAETPKAKEAKKLPFAVWQDRRTGQYFVGIRGINGVVRLKTGFPDVKAARQHLADNRADLEAMWQGMKEHPEYRRTVNEPRQGPARRDGDVSPQMFQDAFGFRGVQFGNWVESDRRQTDLNQAYDALMDLAEALGVPPKAMSLDGSLGLAFGARGVSKYKAHYEPGEVVINLTKKTGPGSLAHEWFHAFDNYFARLDDTGATKARPLDKYATTQKPASAPKNMRPEVWQAFRQIATTLKTGPFAERSATLDDARSKPYYSTLVEKSARAFEKYIADRLIGKDITNDYLVNIVKDESPALPTSAEMADGIQAAYDNLFNILDSVPTETGVMLRNPPATPQPLPADEGGQPGLANPPGGQAAVTPAQDAEYMAAVEAGDLEKAQRMVDEAAGGDQIIKNASTFDFQTGVRYVVNAFHGSKSQTPITVFDKSKLGSNTFAESAKKGFFFAGSKETASSKDYYIRREFEASESGEEWVRDYNKAIKSLIREAVELTSAEEVNGLPFGSGEFVSEWGDIGVDVLLDGSVSDDPEYIISSRIQFLRDELAPALEALGVDAKADIDALSASLPDSYLDTSEGQMVNAYLFLNNPMVFDDNGNEYREQSYADRIDEALKNGHDSVIIKNTFDGGPLDTIFVVFDPSQIKSADPVTRDESGNVIPLSQRFNPASPSILRNPPGQPGPARQSDEAQAAELEEAANEAVREAEDVQETSDMMDQLRKDAEAADALRNDPEAVAAVQASGAMSGRNLSQQFRDPAAREFYRALTAARDMVGGPATVVFDEMRKWAAQQVQADPDKAIAFASELADEKAMMKPEEQAVVGAVIEHLNRVVAMTGDKATRLLLHRLGNYYLDIGTLTAQALAGRRDPLETPQDRWNKALTVIFGPDSKVRRRLALAPTAAAKARRIAELEAQLAGYQAGRRADIEAALKEARGQETQEEILERSDADNEKLKANILKRVGIMEQDMTLSTVDRYSLQTAILELPAVREALDKFDYGRDIMRLAFQGRSDRHIAGALQINEADVAKFIEEVRNGIIRPALAAEVKAGKGWGEMIRSGFDSLARKVGLRMAAVSGPLGTMAPPLTQQQQQDIENEVNRILNYALQPARRRNKAGSLIAKVIDTPGGKKVRVFVPFDPEDMASFYAVAREFSAAKASVTDKLYEYWINWPLLSGPQTQVANLTGNAANVLWHYTAQRMVEAGMNVLYRDPNSAKLGEFKHVAKAFMGSIMPALDMARQSFLTEGDSVRHKYLGEPMEIEFKDGSLDKVGAYRPSIGGKAGQLARLPGRLLRFTDAFFKTSILQMEATAIAYRAAAFQAKQQGLTGKNRDAFLESEIANALANPGSQVWTEANKTAEELLFQDENAATDLVDTILGGNRSVRDLEKLMAEAEAKGDNEGAAKLRNRLFWRKVQGKIMRIIFPFQRTPTNIIKVGLRKAGGSAVVGLWHAARAGLFKVRDGEAFLKNYTKAMQIKDVSESLLAGLGWMMLASMFEGDDDDEKKPILIVGNRPYAPGTQGEREAFLRSTGGANSILFRDKDGKVITSFNFSRYEPVATLLSAWVDGYRNYMEVNRRRKQGEADASYLRFIGSSLMASVEGKSFLQGFSGVMETIRDFEERRDPSTSNWAAKQLINGAIPNLIKQPLRNWDDLIRDTKTAGIGYTGLPNPEVAPKLPIFAAEPKVTATGERIRKGFSPPARLLFQANAVVKPQPDALLLRANRLNPVAAWYPQPLQADDYYVREPGAKRGTPGYKAPIADPAAKRRFAELDGKLYADAARRITATATPAERAKPTESLIEKFKKAREQARAQARVMGGTIGLQKPKTPAITTPNK